MYCTNCGQQLDENGVCPNCGKSVSSPIQQNHLTPPTLKKRSNLFPILYIISVLLLTIFCIVFLCMMKNNVENKYSDYGITCKLKSVSWFLLYALTALSAVCFMFTRRNFKWCAILLILSYLILGIANGLLSIDIYDVSALEEYGKNLECGVEDEYQSFSNLADDFFNRYYDKDLARMTIISIIGTVMIFNIPSVVLAVGMLKISKKRTFSIVVTISLIIGIFTSNFFMIPMLFMGLSIRNDFDLLLLEREQKKVNKAN